MYGDNDFADGILLRFLGITDAQVLEAVRTHPDDAAAAERILVASGKTPEQCAAFNRRFLLLAGLFLPFIEADEGRAKPGLRTSFLRAFYNGVVAGPAIAVFRRMQGKPAARR